MYEQAQKHVFQPPLTFGNKKRNILAPGIRNKDLKGQS